MTSTSTRRAIQGTEDSRVAARHADVRHQQAHRLAVLAGDHPRFDCRIIEVGRCTCRPAVLARCCLGADDTDRLCAACRQHLPLTLSALHKDRS